MDQRDERDLLRLLDDVLPRGGPGRTAVVAAGRAAFCWRAVDDELEQVLVEGAAAAELSTVRPARD
jgi:hypothetical protein